MYIIYKTNKLSKICTNKNLADREYGSRVADKLFLRQNELAAFECLSDVSTYPPYRRHTLINDRHNQISITITERYRIILEPIYECSEDMAQKDYSKVKGIRILEVSNHYDD